MSFHVYKSTPCLPKAKSHHKKNTFAIPSTFCFIITMTQETLLFESPSSFQVINQRPCFVFPILYSSYAYGGGKAWVRFGVLLRPKVAHRGRPMPSGAPRARAAGPTPLATPTTPWQPTDLNRCVLVTAATKNPSEEKACVGAAGRRSATVVIAVPRHLPSPPPVAEEVMGTARDMIIPGLEAKNATYNLCRFHGEAAAPTANDVPAAAAARPWWW